MAGAVFQIEEELDREKTTVWGFCIYRCTYESDTDWTAFLNRLTDHLKEGLEFGEGEHLLESHEMTVFDNRALFDGATTTQCREHFADWADRAPNEEGDPGFDRGSWSEEAARYNYFIHVDAASMHSALAETQPGTGAKGYVNLVQNSWAIEDEEPPEGDSDSDGYLTPQPQYPPIEGMTVERVGFVRVGYADALLGVYAEMYDPNGWNMAVRICGRPPNMGDPGM